MRLQALEEPHSRTLEGAHVVTTRRPQGDGGRPQNQGGVSNVRSKVRCSSAPTAARNSSTDVDRREANRPPARWRRRSTRACCWSSTVHCAGC